MQPGQKALWQGGGFNLQNVFTVRGEKRRDYSRSVNFVILSTLATASRVTS